uniref:Ribonuclease P/MRP subunit p40 n=1 Tax=Canis lupus familiaris TaxID=9615 RepID=A0A8C0SFE2_CANLF
MATLRRLREVPRHLLVCEKSNFGHDKSRHRHLVETHYHNYRVSFLIPECGILSKELKNLVMETGPYYFVKNLPLHELITQEFINTFVKKGSCYALTHNTNIDEDNTVALLPNGKLILSLDKDTYEETGLQGRPSQYSGRKVMKFIVSIDLMDLSFNPNSKKYERISWSFKEKKPLKFDFLLAWHHTGAEESTMMSYFSNYRIQELQPKIALSTVTELQCPVLRSGALQGEPEAACSAPELLDWLGAVFSRADLTNEPNSFVSTYCCPQPSTVVARAYLCTITGFILPEKICLLLEQLWLVFSSSFWHVASKPMCHFHHKVPWILQRHGTNRLCIYRDVWVAQQLSICLHLERGPGAPGSSPTSGSLHGACFSLCLGLCLCVCVCVCLMNK